jgi:hypothetical protein
MTTLASPTATLPIRWWIAMSQSGHRSRASAPMRANTVCASGACAS